MIGGIYLSSTAGITIAFVMMASARPSYSLLNVLIKCLLEVLLPYAQYAE